MFTFLGLLNMCKHPPLSQVHSHRVMETEGTLPEELSPGLYLMNIEGGYFGSGLVRKNNGHDCNKEVGRTARCQDVLKNALAPDAQPSLFKNGKDDEMNLMIDMQCFDSKFGTSTNAYYA